jgi:hypothetical protein
MDCPKCGSSIFVPPNPANPPLSSSGSFPQSAPQNQVGPYYKEIDTIPPGEVRVLFIGLVAGALPQIVFTNPKSVTIEVVEIFFQSVGGNTVTLFQGNGNIQMTPPLELADGFGYSDSGFLLPAGQTVALTVAGAGTVGGFMRWRYA